MIEKHNILIIDNDRNMGRSLEMILNIKGYGTTASHSGRGAIEIIKQKKIHIVLLDINILDLDGPDILSEITQNASCVDVILTTSYATKESAIQFLNSGAIAFLIKPLDIDMLLSTIKNATDRQTLLLQKEIVENELRDNKRMLTTLLNNLPGMVYRKRTGSEYGMEYLSDGSFELTGYQSSEFLRSGNMSYEQLIHPEDKNVYSASMEKFSMKKEKCYEQTYRIITANKEVKWVFDKGVRISSDEDKVIFLEGIITDISEQKKLEEQLFQSQKMEAIGTLAGGIAHDFNNLLTAILGYSQILLNDLSPDDLTFNNIQEIYEAGLRAAGLTNQLLAYSRKHIVHKENMSVNNAIVNFEKMLGRILGEDIEIILNLSKDIGQVNADKGQIDQIILNLATNARDAMPCGGKFIIETKNHKLDNNLWESNNNVIPGTYTMLSFSDNGMGMSKDVQNKMFDPYFTTKDVDKGTGLGLSTILGIVKQNNGYISVNSEIDKGTSFKILFPSVNNIHIPVHKKIESSKDYTGSETIFVVEDDNTVRQFITKSLLQNGYCVHSSDCFSDAMIKYNQLNSKIDLLLTDVILPQESGKIIAETFLQKQPDIKVLYMSGYTNNLITNYNINNNKINFIQKPFKINDILKMIREILDRACSGVSKIRKTSGL